jgi:hypothetical protein
MFADIEGSTRLLEEPGDGYPALLAYRPSGRRLKAVSGEKVDPRGDGFFFAFDNAEAAARFALQAQQKLAA